MRKISGFSLIEILIVIFIIGVLVTITTVAGRGARLVGRNNQRRNELEQIRSALEVWRSDNSTYPTAGGEAETVLTGLVADYLPKVPVDPLPNDFIYYYVSSGGLTYQLCAHLEGTTADIGGNCNNASCGDNNCNYQVVNP